MGKTVGAPTGERRRHQAAECIAGAPVAKHPTSLVGGEEGAYVLAETRPAGGLGKPLDHHAGSEDRQRRNGAHDDGRQGGRHKAAQHNDTCPETIGEYAPHELADRVGGEIERIEVRHRAFLEFETRVFADT
ncbi:hypothetical protein D9M69_479120 [compost metagenome]